jgi:hypothetical protein
MSAEAAAVAVQAWGLPTRLFPRAPLGGPPDRVGAGLISDDGIASAGPPNRLVVGATAIAADGPWLRTGLLRPMRLGGKPSPAGVPTSGDGRAPPRFARGLFGAGAGAAAPGPAPGG